MEDIKEDKLANQVLESLPPSFMVFGKQTDLNPMEEFWMNKLTNIEKQYDLHIVDLERKLLSEKATRRSIKKQTGKIAKLEESLGEHSAQLERVTETSRSLKGRLKEKEFEAKSLHQKLERSVTIQKNISKRMEDERKARIQYEKECASLKNKLKKMEKERGQLLLDVEIKESEKGRVEERESNLHREKWSFIKSLTDVETERRIQTNTNLKLCQDIEKLLGIDKSLEMSLLKERQVMGELMDEMKSQREEHKQVLRELDLAVKERRNVDDVLEYSLKKVKEKERDVLNYKEELRFKEGDNSIKTQEIRDLKRRNSNIRCMLADTKQKLNNCLSEMKSLENEKRRTDVELESSRLHEKSLHLEMKKNDIRKYKLAEKILKAHPFLMMNKKERADSNFGSRRQSGTSSGIPTEIESYKKQIWKLERSKDDLERRLRELQRKENVYRLKLDKYGEMERQIFWTGKAMAKMEGDRQRLEGMLNTMESNMPVRVPFKKLVTDPSVLDRLAKNKVLQKRLFRQTEKMEELKSNARRILQYREEEFGAMGHFQEEIPVWKLSYWNKQNILPDGVLSGLNIDVEKHAKSASLRSLTDDASYKNYLHYLDEEIPKLKEEIETLERKKNYIETEKENEEGRRKKALEIAEERQRLAELLLDDERPVEEDAAAKACAGKGGGDEGEGDDSGDGQMTAELSMHGSSFGDANKAEPQPVVGGSEKRKLKRQSEHTVKSSDGEASSEAASDIPTD